MGGVKDGDHGSICGLRVPGVGCGGVWRESFVPAYKHGLGDVVLVVVVVVGIGQFVCLFCTLPLGWRVGKSLGQTAV